MAKNEYSHLNALVVVRGEGTATVRKKVDSPTLFFFIFFILSDEIRSECERARSKNKKERESANEWEKASNRARMFDTGWRDGRMGNWKMYVNVKPSGIEVSPSLGGREVEI